jgi:uncharacterized membrane protein YesL
MKKLWILIATAGLFISGSSYATLPHPKKISKRCSLEDNIENHCRAHHKYKKGFQNNNIALSIYSYSGAEVLI